MRLFSVKGAEKELEEKALGGSVGSTAGGGTTKEDGDRWPDDAAGCRKKGYVHVSGSFRMTQCRHGGPCSSHCFQVLFAQHRFVKSTIWRGSEPPEFRFTLTCRFLQLWHPFRDLVWDFLLSMKIVLDDGAITVGVFAVLPATTACVVPCTHKKNCR